MAIFSRFKIGFALLLGCFVFVSPLMAQVGVGGNIFERGRSRVAISGGMGGAFDEDYFVLGLGAGYYIANGLEIGLDGEAWWGNDPNIYKISPQIRYVFYQSPTLTPYIGAFYRRTFFESLTDLDSFGGRAGVYSRLGRNAYMGLGVVYEKYMDCRETKYNECDTTYPEFIIGAGF